MQLYGDGVTPIPREDVSICDGRSWLLDRSFSIQQFPSNTETATIFAHVEDWAAGLLSFPDVNNEEDIEPPLSMKARRTNAFRDRRSASSFTEAPTRRLLVRGLSSPFG